MVVSPDSMHLSSNSGAAFFHATERGTPMKAIRIILFFAGMFAAAWISGQASSRVFMQVATIDTRGNYTVDSLGATAAMIAYVIVFALLMALLVRVVYAGRPVDRIFVILGGYLAACLGAGFVLTIEIWIAALLAPDGRSAMMPLTIILPGTLLAGGYIAVFALLPTLLVIMFTELAKVRSAVFYGLVGVSAAIFGYNLYLVLFIRGTFDLDVLGGDVLGGLLFFAVPGLAGGLIYWRIAGRSAGQKSLRPAPETRR